MLGPVITEAFPDEVTFNSLEFRWTQEGENVLAEGTEVTR